MDDIKRYQFLDKEIEKYSKEYADKCTELYKTEGFDIKEKKWNKKIQNLADEYAIIIQPLRAEFRELEQKLTKEAISKRSKKFRDVD